VVARYYVLSSAVERKSGGPDNKSEIKGAWSKRWNEGCISSDTAADTKVHVRRDTQGDGKTGHRKCQGPG
jgi:hypothetical protein